MAGEGGGAGHWEAGDGMRRSSGIACAPVGESGSWGVVRAGLEQEGDVDNGGMALQCRHMKTSVQRWGNSLAVRIPRAFAAETRIEDGTEVELLLKGDDLVVRPVRRRRLALSELLKKVTPTNRQDEVSSGAPVGQEIW